SSSGRTPPGRADRSSPPPSTCEAIASTLSQAQHLLEQAVADNAAGRPNRASRSLRAASRLLGEGELPPEEARLRVRTLMGLATAGFERSGLDEALEWLARATARAEELGDAEL